MTTKVAKVIAAARAHLAKMDAVQDAVDCAPRGAGFVPMPREQRESAEHKALRAALAEFDAPPDGRCAAVYRFDGGETEQCEIVGAHESAKDGARVLLAHHSHHASWFALRDEESET